MGTTGENYFDSLSTNTTEIVKKLVYMILGRILKIRKSKADITVKEYIQKRLFRKALPFFIRYG